MIEMIFLKILAISLWACGFILLLKLCLPFLRKRYTAWWRCLIWVLLAVRLLVPLTLQFPAMQQFRADTGRSATSMAAVRYLVIEAEERKEPEVLYPAEVPQELSVTGIAASVWLGGMVIFAVIQSFFYLRFRHQIRRFSLPASTPVQDSCSRLCGELAIGRVPAVSICSVIGTPLLAGVLRPRLLLPHEHYDQQELLCIFRHELIHLHRGDLWYKLVFLLANCIHWFNPAVYLMTAEAGKDIEMACDEEAVQTFNKDERVFYGNSLIRALPKKRRMDLMMTTNFGSAKETMKLRLNALLDGRFRSRGWLGLCLMMGLIVILGAGLPFPVTASPKDGLTAGTTELPLQRLPHIVQFADGETSVQRIQCGPYTLSAGIEYTLTITWKEGGEAALNCVGIGEDAVQNGIRSSYTITGGIPLQLTVPADGYYYMEIPGGLAHTDLRYELKPLVLAAASVTFNYVELLHYSDGSPYLHDSVTNNSGRNIKEYERGMMAFDKEGNPLKMRWNPFSDMPKSHYFLYDWGEEDILDGAVHEVSGGWSLDTAQKPVNDTGAIGYVIYCFRQITFDDGSVWINPDYEQWLDTYQDKKVNPELLAGYYPYTVSLP